jgi:hypothetical protein
MRKAACAVDLEQRTSCSIVHGRPVFTDVAITLVKRFELQH